VPSGRGSAQTSRPLSAAWQLPEVVLGDKGTCALYAPEQGPVASGVDDSDGGLDPPALVC
jgi:hypothetical protein